MLLSGLEASGKLLSRLAESGQKILVDPENDTLVRNIRLNNGPVQLARTYQKDIARPERLGFVSHDKLHIAAEVKIYLVKIVVVYRNRFRSRRYVVEDLKRASVHFLPALVALMLR